jgi:hypothetical protein
MRLITRRGRGILMFAILFVMLLSTGVSAQDMDVAVYVAGYLPINEKNIFGT